VSAPTSAANAARYSVSASDSWLTFEARSTLHGVHGKASDLSGSVEVARNEDGSIAAEPVPKMHVEFPVEQLRTGNGMQDREMWKVIDSKRFPRIAADLRELRPGMSPGRYGAGGDVTMSGRARRYDGECTISADGDGITIEGDLSVDIRDFGLTPPKLMIIKVDPVVRVHLHLVAMKAA
jgi:hypothetical protein